MKNYRYLKIVKHLLENDGYLTVDQIANFHKVSNRTIRNDFVHIEKLIKKSDIELIRKPGTGIKLSGTTESKLSLLNHITDEVQDNNLVMAPVERQQQMILKILSNESVRIFELQNLFHVSRATIQNDLVAIEKLVSKHNLTLNKMGVKGVSIEGKERVIRNLMFELMLDTNPISKMYDIIQNKSYEAKGDFVFFGLDITDDEIMTLIKYIKNTGHNLQVYYNPIFIIQLFFRMLIVIKRVEIGNTLSLSEEFVDELSFYEDSKIITDNLIEAMNKYLNTTLSQHEYTYLQAYVIAYRPGNDFEKKYYAEVYSFIKSLLVSWEDKLDIPLKNDQVLYESLAEHLHAVYWRVKHNIPITNPMLDDIFSMYPNTYNIVKESIVEINDDLWNLMSVEEVSYLTLYLANALERYKEPLQTLLVIDYILVSDLILKEKIELNCREIIIKDIIQQQSLKSVDMSEYDLILTTKELDDVDIPTIVIPQFLTDTDIINLKKSVSEPYKRKNDPLR